jgi:hypothetical protein
MTDESELTGLTESGALTPSFMRLLFLEGILGTKEFRSWLAVVDSNFKTVRDADVDNEIDRQARERQEVRLEEERRQEELLEAERQQQSS